MVKTDIKYVQKDVHKGKAMFRIFPGLCKGCGLCREKCPEEALSWSEELGVYGTPTVVADAEKCKACSICERVCPDCAIAIERKAKQKKEN